MSWPPATHTTSTKRTKMPEPIQIWVGGNGEDSVVYSTEYDDYVDYMVELRQPGISGPVIRVYFTNGTYADIPKNQAKQVMYRSSP